MMFLVVLGLTTVSGVRSEYNCSSGPPPCWNVDIFPEDVAQEYRRSGKILPSDELVKAFCPVAIQLLECIREYDILPCLVDYTENIDFVAGYNAGTEFCNEESDVRKGYAAHVDCVNKMNFTDQACLRILGDIEMELHTEEMRGILEEKEVSRTCVLLHLFKSCAVEMVEDSCGEEAGQTANDIIGGIENILRCGRNSAEIFAEILSEVYSRIENVV